MRKTHVQQGQYGIKKGHLTIRSVIRLAHGANQCFGQDSARQLLPFYVRDSFVSSIPNQIISDWEQEKKKRKKSKVYF